MSGFSGVWRSNRPIVTSGKRRFTQGGETVFMRIAGLLSSFKENSKAEPLDLCWGNLRGSMGTPLSIRATRSRVAMEDDGAYAPSKGLGKALEALDEKLSREAGMKVGQENILMGYGATWLMESIIKYSVDEKSAVLFPEFAYPPFISMVEERGGNLYAYRSQEDRQPDVEHLERQIRKAKREGHNVKFIYVNSPHNPTTAVYTKENLRRILDVAKKHELFIVADDVYFNVAVPGKRKLVLHMASLLNEDDKGKVPVLQLGSLSKEAQMCNARLGWLYFINSEQEEMRRLRNGVLRDCGLHLSAPSQKMLCEIALKTDHIRPLAKKIVRRHEAMRGWPSEGMSLGERPIATFYWKVRLEAGFGKWKDDGDFAVKAARECGVGLAPTMSFYCGRGKPPEQSLRVALILTPQEIREAGGRLGEFMLRNKR